MKFTTFDLNNGQEIFNHELESEKVEKYIETFRKYILPSILEIHQRPNKKSFNKVDNRHITAWQSAIRYGNGHVERQVRFRFGWETDVERTMWMLKVGFMRLEFKAGRRTAPWVIAVAGVYTVTISEDAWCWTVDERAAELGLGKVVKE